MTPVAMAEKDDAEVADVDAPDPVAWAHMVLPSAASYVRRVILLEGTPGATGPLQVARLNLDSLAALSFMDFAQPDDTAWSDQLNRRGGWAGRGAGRRLSVLLMANDADAALVVPPGKTLPKDLVLLKPDGDAALTTEGQAQQVKPGVKAIATALRRLFGYDAVVIAQEGAYVLARTPDLGRAAKLFHAVALADSVGKDIIGAESAVATAFLRLAKYHDHYAVWRVVSTTLPGPLLPGTKLWLEVGRR